MKTLAAQSNPLPALQTLLGDDARGLTRDLFDLLPVGIYVCDSEGRVIDYNRAAAELWGHAPERGDPAVRFCGSYRLYDLDGAPVPHEHCPMATVLASGSPRRDEEIVIERHDGTRLTALASIEPIRDGDGRLAGAVNVFRDNSAQRRSDARYRTIFNCAQVSLWEIDFSGVVAFLDDLRASGVADLRRHLEEHPESLRQAIGRRHITAVNPYTLELFEAAQEATLLQALPAIFLPDTERMHLEQLVALWEGRRRVVAESSVRTLKGRRMEIAVTIAFEGERGQRSIASVHDITARKRSELAAQRLAAIVESSDDAILSKDLNGTITSWNLGAERLFGYTAEEAIGQPVTMLIPEDRHDEEPMILANVRGGVRTDHYETLRRHKDGSLIPISLTISPIRTADGTVIGASKIARDITDRVEAQEQQELLLREMNHRIKNLLTLSSGLVSLSARYAETPAQLALAVQERLQALARAQEIILPRMSDALGETAPSTTLRALIKTIVSPYDVPLPDAPSRIAVRGAEVEISGRAATGFALLVHEFATNAAKYGALSTAAGRITIDCSEEDGLFVLLWREHGGPPATHDSDGPNRDAKGFGEVLTRATVQGQLRGEITKDWGEDGLTIRLSAPKERLLM